MWAHLKPTHNKENHRGFTIVELLIVIVVIGILAAIVIVAYNGVQQKAHNAQIISGVQAYRKALLSYQAVNGSYPTQTGCLGVNYPSGNCWVGTNGNFSINAALDTALSAFINPKPTIGSRYIQYTSVDQRMGLLYSYGTPSRIQYYLEGLTQTCIDGTTGASFPGGEGTQCIESLP
jgi:prepilin-type N-terminal cleavage/methylation domain-containing protein